MLKAKRMWLVLTIGLLAIVGAAALNLAAQRGSLRAAYALQRDAERARQVADQPTITEETIAGLPAPVQRYMRATGNVGRPRVPAVAIAFDTEMFNAPGQNAMRGPSEQYDRFDEPKRLFFMTTWRGGLPVAVLHDYQGIRASMRVTIASLVKVVQVTGPELAKTETVTVLNDLCVFAPSWMTDPRLKWRAVDDRHVDVTFTNGPYRVSARLEFNERDELVDFTSGDRGALQPDGSFRYVPWSTPVRDYRDIGGRRIPTVGEAIWHFPEGAFTYGRFKVRSADYAARTPE